MIDFEVYEPETVDPETVMCDDCGAKFRDPGHHDGCAAEARQYLLESIFDCDWDSEWGPEARDFAWDNLLYIASYLTLDQCNTILGELFPPESPGW